MEVTGVTAERALQIERGSIVSGEVNPSTGHLMLKNGAGVLTDAGAVRPQTVGLRTVETVTINSSRTWYSPSDETDKRVTKLVFHLWGGGGSGGRALSTQTHATGGGGGGYLRLEYDFEAAGAFLVGSYLCTVVIGAGGAAEPTPGNPGRPGGNTTIAAMEIPSPAYPGVIKYPGAPFGVGGGAGGGVSVGGSDTNSGGGGGSDNILSPIAGVGAVSGGSGERAGGYAAFYGGGAGSAVVGGLYVTPGRSTYGGGGGGVNSGPGGFSRFGGVGNTQTGSPMPASIPAGGGSGGKDPAQSCPGAPGLVIIEIHRVSIV